MDVLPAAKRAKTSGGESFVSRRSGAAFVDIPDDALLLLAQFASPPEVYNLCLTNQDRFFRSAGNAAPAVAHNNDVLARGGNAPNALVCTKLLRFSLLSSLSHILRNSKAGLELAQVSFSEMPLGSVLVAGSTMVQCCLGERWEESDIDLFCTASAAPAVRSWLIKEARQLFQGFCDSYVGVSDDTHAIGSKRIHHVEYYCNLPDEGHEAPHFRASLFSYDQACEYGKTVNEKYASYKWGPSLLSKASVKDAGSQYRIKTAAGDPLPFNYLYDSRKDASFDLVISSDKCSTATELLEDFDLNICKASWNGRFFSIPDPHLTFTRRSKMEPQRKVLMESYKRNLLSVQDNEVDDLIALAHAKVAAELVDSPFCRDADEVMDDVELGLQFHNFVCKLYERLVKYQGRGIQVQDAPETQDF